jgi:hypothetical protein
MSKIFPNFYKALTGNDMRPALSYAIIEDGKIIATNGHILIFCNFGVYVENPELAERKVFDRDLLKWMTGKQFFRLDCTKNGIAGYSNTGEKEERPYSGYFEITEKQKKDSQESYPVRPIHLYSEEHSGKDLSFPNWKSAIPGKPQNDEPAGINSLGFDVDYLKVIADCFAFSSKNRILKMELRQNGSAIHLSPGNETLHERQNAILMAYNF